MEKIIEKIKITEENVGEIRLRWLKDEITLNGKPLEKETDIKVGDIYEIIKNEKITQTNTKRKMRKKGN